jgi:hypothetical protein
MKLTWTVKGITFLRHSGSTITVLSAISRGGISTRSTSDFGPSTTRHRAGAIGSPGSPCSINYRWNNEKYMWILCVGNNDSPRCIWLKRDNSSSYATNPAFDILAKSPNKFFLHEWWHSFTFIMLVISMYFSLNQLSMAFDKDSLKFEND